MQAPRQDAPGTRRPPSTVIDSGPITGSIVDAGGRGVSHYGGVPFATADRFGVPRTPAPWAEPRRCDAPGAAPPQLTAGLDLVPGMVPPATSEDFLSAEVWTPAGPFPAPGESRPVLVWIPGGSFRVGGASLPTYDGRWIAAEHDVVVVGLNYRLGLLGFLAAPGVPSNLGLRDLLAALDWVRRNAPAFGGDPQRIVLVGESAGAGAILHLLTRPDLPVSRAIVFSGSATMTQDEATAAEIASRTLELAGVVGIDEWRTLPVDAILAAQQAAVERLAGRFGMMIQHPWVDGDVVPRSPLEAAAEGALAPVPLVVGTTADEMELFRANVPVLPVGHAVRMLAPRAAALGLDPVDVGRGLAACGDDLVSAVADVDLHLPALVLAESHARRGLPVWRARFGWRSPQRGACHALDLPFHFGTLDVDRWREFAGAGGQDAADADRLSSRLRAAWAAFARTGVPASEPLGEWPAWTPGGKVISLGRRLEVVDDPDAARLGIWRRRTHSA